MVPNKRAGFPTPFHEVNLTLQHLEAQLRSILGEQFVGMVLYGSLALGDFDPQHSDIDFVVITRSELDGEKIKALGEMHAQFDRSGSPWAGRLEVAYLPLAALGEAPEEGRYPQVEKGTALTLAPLEPGWAFQRYTLREKGVVVAGPDPAGITSPVERGEMQRAARAILGEWQALSHRDPEWIEWLRQRENQSFVILTICRMLYSLETGGVASKPAAARWAMERLGPHREGLLRGALRGQHEAGRISEQELRESLELLEEAVERVNQTTIP